MKKRLDALSRIGRFQALIHDVGRSRLHSLHRQQTRLSDDLKAVLATLGEGEIAYGGPALLSARRIRSLQQRLDHLACEIEATHRSVLTQGTRAKLAEQAIEAAALSYRRLNERKELADLIERTIARRSASST